MMSLETLNQVCSPIVFWISTYNHTQALIVKLQIPRWSIPQLKSLSDAPFHPHHHHRHRGHHHHDPQHVDDARVGYHLGKGWRQRRIRSSGRPPSSLDGRYEQLARNSYKQLASSLKQLFPLLSPPAQLCLSMYAAPKHIAESCTFAHSGMSTLNVKPLTKTNCNCNAFMLSNKTPGYDCALLICFWC